MPVLESIGRAAVGYQLAQDRLNDRRDSVQLGGAVRENVPVRDDRMKISAATFGGLLTASLFLWIVMRIWLRRTQRMFGVESGPDLAILESASGWSSPPEEGPES